MTGYAQVFHRRLGLLRPLERPQSVAALLFCGVAVLGNFVLLSLVPQVTLLAATGAQLVLAVTLVTLWGVSLGARLLDVHLGVVDSAGFTWLLVSLTPPLYSLAAIEGLVEYPLSWQGEWFRVRKEG